MSTLLDYYGPNAGYVLELYERYQQDPASVDPETRARFADGFAPPLSSPDGGGVVSSPPAPVWGAIPGGANTPSTRSNEPLAPKGAGGENLTKVVAVARLARIVRELGHLEARLDPLGSPPPGDRALELATHDLTTDDLAALPASVIGGPLAKNAANALEALGKLRQAYSGSVGYEDDHIQITEEREWLRDAAETGRFFQQFTAEDKREVLERLSEVDTFEQFLQKTPPFQGQKRFSIEGLDMMVPILDAIVHCTARTGTREVVIGMAHRGRLNVLAHILGKPYAAILSEFPNPNAPHAKPAVSGTGALGYTGDVKYHKGYRRGYVENGINEMPITLAPNPSHLEFVNPAVVGRARAAQETRDHAGVPVRDKRASLAIVIHGDAAFPGQGVVAETLNLGQISGYTVGGTIHLIANNQIGFTTTPREGRSTLYASDLAKGFEVPIVHVNADDPASCIAVARMACAYREKFGKDFLIDLIGYRRLGHNEGEEPAFTQPRMYEKIRQYPRVREIWAKELEKQGLVTRDEAEALVAAVQARLMEAKNAPPAEAAAGATRNPDALTDAPEAAGPQTAVPAHRLTAINEAITTAPEGFTVDAKLARMFVQPRKAALGTEGGILWAHAEALALGSILEDGTPIRLTGQDTERGTFTQRHLVLHDPTTGLEHNVLHAVPTAQASFALINSPLSETAVLGFEYGYSVHATDTLVLWEAQFGDFVNGAQVIVDQFIASGNAKWHQSPSVVLLLPHGYEGQGPEHSSGRVERFLQLCAGDSMRVVNCTTAAQYFHLLRRQAAQLEAVPRPLVVMTPKALLRHPRAASSLSDLTEGTFQPVLDDPRGDTRRERVTRLALCTGKVYIDLVYGGGPKFAPRDEYVGGDSVAVARVEELNPFPTDALTTLLASYPNLREVVWVQEEPRNMGAWTFLQPRFQDLLTGKTVLLRYIGRPESSSPAEGSITDHGAEQERIVAEAYKIAGDITRPSDGSSQNGRNGSSAAKNGAGAKAKTGAPVATTTQITEVNSERGGGETVPS
ncbi:MAG: 2-oxoglutarate dehydrogenase E1 component [Cytophagales bacterium]|nr:2-oxoglutarate dehydrogenase E1 component [Armatimonadota bacterium]